MFLRFCLTEYGVAHMEGTEWLYRRYSRRHRLTVYIVLVVSFCIHFIRKVVIVGSLKTSYIVDILFDEHAS